MTQDINVSKADLKNLPMQEKENRLALSLRENLLKRKAQQKSRSDVNQSLRLNKRPTINKHN